MKKIATLFPSSKAFNFNPYIVEIASVTVKRIKNRIDSLNLFIGDDFN
jgi:hypothetical protein